MGMDILKSVQGLKSKCELLKEERNITPATIICYLTCITGKFLIPVISGAAFLGQNSPGLD